MSQNPENNVPVQPQLTKKSSSQNNQTVDSFEVILNKISEDFKDVEFLKYLSEKLGFHMGYLILGFFVTSFLFIIFGVFSSFIVNLTGFGYPAFQTIQSYGSKRDNVRQWNTYWVIFMILSIYDCVLQFIVDSFLPLYHPIKVLFIIWLFYPKSQGAFKIYEKVVRRIIDKLDKLLTGLIREEQIFSK